MNKIATEFESKTPGTVSLATKAALNTKTPEIENKIPDTANFSIKKRADFIIKDVDSNHREIEKLKKTKTTDLSFLLTKNYFDNDRSQNLSIFQPMAKTFTTLTGDAETITA